MLRLRGAACQPSPEPSQRATDPAPWQGCANPWFSVLPKAQLIVLDDRFGSWDSDVPCQALGARLVVSRPCGREFVGGWLVQGRGRDLETSVISFADYLAAIPETENVLWGQKRIQAELARLGYRVSARTVAKYMRGLPGPPHLGLGHGLSEQGIAGVHERLLG